MNAWVRIVRLCFASISMMAILGAGGWAYAQDKIVFRVSSEINLDIDPNPAMVHWKGLVERETNGRVEVRLIHSAQLFDDDAALDAVASGAFEAVTTTTSRLTGFSKDYEVLDLPFVFKDAGDFRRKLTGPLGAVLDKSLQKAGMRVVTFWAGGPIVILNNEGKLQGPEDWRGKKIRLFGGSVYEATVEAVGGRPIALPASEVPTAMQVGTIDAIVTNWDGWLYFIDLVNYGMDPGGWYLAFAFVVNADFWENLPADIRVIMERTLKEATNRDWDDKEELVAQQIQKIRDHGGKTPYEIEPAARAAWVEASEEVRQRFSSSIDPEVFGIATR